MKKDQFDKLIEQQRKNLKFTSSEQKPENYGRFVVAGEEPVHASAELKHVQPRPVSVAPVQSQQHKDYVDIRKLKMERRQKTEQGTNDDRSFDDEPDKLPQRVIPQKPVRDLAVDFSRGQRPVQPRTTNFSAPAAAPLPPAPKSVLAARKPTAKKKIDSDLVEKKTYATFFDDLR